MLWNRIRNYLKNRLPRPFQMLYFYLNVLHFKVIPWVPTYDEDQIITCHACDFTSDPHFKSCYDSAVKKGLAISKTIRWRAHVLCWAASNAKKLEGDFVECGVAKGFLSKIVADFIDFRRLSSKRFYLLDTYEGIPTKYLTASEKEKGVNIFEPSYEKVLDAFSEYENVIICKGPVPDTLLKVPSTKIAFLHLDMNCVLPEIEAAEFFWDKLVPGAMVILDDYGHSGHEEQKKGFDEFSIRKGVPLLALPTGQGLIIKL